MRLEFGCSGGPVPWEFVADFANSQKDAVERGFAVGYKREWWFEKRKGKGKGERVCYAGLRVADVGREVVPPKRGGNEAG